MKLEEIKKTKVYLPL